MVLSAAYEMFVYEGHASCRLDERHVAVKTTNRSGSLQHSHLLSRHANQNQTCPIFCSNLACLRNLRGRSMCARSKVDDR
jgi:hypothetical protein